MQSKTKTPVRMGNSCHKNLRDLRSIGPATVEDLEILGISSVAQLAGHDSVELYQRLCRIIGICHDPCVLDVFRAGIEQAKNSNLEVQKKDWWYWSKVRKGSIQNGKTKPKTHSC